MATQTLSVPGFHEPFCALSHLIGACGFAVLTVFLERHGRGEASRVLFLVFENARQPVDGDGR